MSDLETLLRSMAAPALDIVVHLGNASARLVSNLPSFAGANFFSRSALLENTEPADYELWCIDDPDGQVRARIQHHDLDCSYRAASFNIGYYATDHFGTPVALHRFENRYYVIGERLERVVWPYFVKFFIFAKSLQNNQLFLKAAAVAFGRRGVLILGRGSGGKTSLVRELCNRGATMVTNSHAIVDGLMLTGVQSTMRVRAGDGADTAVHRGAALRYNEVLIDPFEACPANPQTSVQLESLCIVDYRKGRDEGVKRLEPGDVLGFMEHFSLGLNVYRLEEEMLEFYHHDVVRCARAIAALQGRLRALAEALPCNLIRTDIYREHNLARVFETIGEPWINTP